MSPRAMQPRPGTFGTYRVPMRLAWRRWNRYVHAFVVGFVPGNTDNGFMLCRVGFKNERKTFKLDSLDLEDLSDHRHTRCTECQRRARLLTMALPHLDEVSRSLAKAALKSIDKGVKRLLG